MRIKGAKQNEFIENIPLGYLLGGWLVDQMFEPFMALQSAGSLFVRIFGEGKGSGAAFLFFAIAIPGILVCLFFRKDRYIWELEEKQR